MTVITAEQKGSEKPEDILKELRFYYTKAILEKIKRLETENSVLQDLVESNKCFISPIIKNGADLEKKLDEAKQIVRDLLFHLGDTSIVSYTSKEESITNAINFLKEVEN